MSQEKIITGLKCHSSKLSQWTKNFVDILCGSEGCVVGLRNIKGPFLACKIQSVGPEKYIQGHSLEFLCLVLFQALEGHIPPLIF
jgi:hypothetical protein